MSANRGYDVWHANFEPIRCEAATKAGSRCKHPATTRVKATGELLCDQHATIAHRRLMGA